MLFIDLCFTFLNLGLVMGLTFAALLLLRPLLKWLLTPQQRVCLWALGWIPAYFTTCYRVLDLLHILPVTFRDLVVPRIGSSAVDVPAYLPRYDGPGPYNLALPGGGLIQVEFSDALVLGISLVWLAGAIAVSVYFTRKDRAIRALISRGEPVVPTQAWLTAYPELHGRVQIRLCDGLETSFLYRGHAKGEAAYFTICLQRELSPQRQELVLRHELEHVGLWHGQFKFFSSVALLLYWWNPLMWLANKYFCRDMELACDRAVLTKLEPEERREYARTLVELGAGRQLWDTPLGFGECDAALRVRAVAVWKRPGLLRTAAGWAAFALVLLFFLGGPQERNLLQDAPLLWQRHVGAGDALVEDISYHLTQQGETARPQEIWLAPGERTSAELYTCLSDGSWRLLIYRIDRDSSEMYFAQMHPLAQPPALEGLYRVG